MHKSSSGSAMKSVKVPDECWEKRSDDREASTFSFSKVLSTHGDNVDSSDKTRHHQEESMQWLNTQLPCLGRASKAKHIIDIDCDPVL